MEESLRKPLPLITEKYSLEPDMIFGWCPRKLAKQAPIPLDFSNTVSNKLESKEVFNGPRPVDSYIVHSSFRDQSTYNFHFSENMHSAAQFISKKNLAKAPETRGFVGMAPDTPSDSLHFNSNFECGNLDKAIMVNANKYDLYIRADSNSSSKGLWFYFEVSHITKSRIVEFNIVNLSGDACLYGIQPMFYSYMLNNINNNIGWHKVLTEIQFKKSKVVPGDSSKIPYFQLTFNLDLTVHDKVKIAASIPYSLSQLTAYIDGLSSPFLKKGNLCDTLSGVPVPCLTINNRSIPKAKKKCILILSRVIPKDTNSSWICEGLINFLLSREGEVLRNKAIFKIIPMGNPDGVIIGNSFNSFAGRNLYTCFSNKSAQFFPMPYYLCKLAQKFKGFLMFDIRAQLKKKGSFTCSRYYPIHDNMYYKSRILPKLFSEKTCMFRYYSCKYIREYPRRFSSILYNESGMTTYTLLSSMYAFIDEHRETVNYSIADFRKLGACLGLTLIDYVLMIEQSQRKKVRLNQHAVPSIHHTIENIKRTDEKTTVDSDIDEWTDEGEEPENNGFLNIISNALTEFKRYASQKKSRILSLPKFNNLKKAPEKQTVEMSLCNFGPNITYFKELPKYESKKRLSQCSYIRASGFMPGHSNLRHRRSSSYYQNY